MMNFKAYNNVTKVVIPNGVQLSNKSFYDKFSGIENLQSVSLPNSTISLANTFNNCLSLNMSPWCGNNVTDMDSTYYNCTNLTGSPVCGENVTSMWGTYWNCVNLVSNGYFYSNNISNMQNCFGNRNISTYLNLYLPSNSTSLTTALINNTSSLVGTEITWTDDTATNGCYYNTAYNIYIYPVENVAAARTANGDD